MLWNPKHDLAVETKNEPWRDVLREAAKLIEERGWCQNLFRTQQGAACAIGGMFGANTSVAELIIYEARERFRAHLGLPEETGEMFLHPVATWNDAPERTKEEVVSALRAAAES